MTKQIIIFTDYSQEELLTLADTCAACQVAPDFIYDLVEYEIICPAGQHPEEWGFDLRQLQRIKTALRLQHDLEINLPGIALVLELLEKIDSLEARIQLLERLMFRPEI